MENGRMPTLVEVENHIDLIETPATKLDPKQFERILLRLINDLTNNLMGMESSISVESTVLHDV